MADDGASPITPLSRTSTLTFSESSSESTLASHAEDDLPKSWPPIQAHAVDNAAASLNLLPLLSACTCAGRKMCPVSHSITSKDISNGIRGIQGTLTCSYVWYLEPLKG